MTVTHFLEFVYAVLNNIDFLLREKSVRLKPYQLENSRF
jgi:hypothetical protein